ncbi:non-ribosomal peptide synthetase [Streptomyces sp. DH24]|uniref:non-ribosomal peptide synthetase n=1 Tax=Streptomyces sp. DH24 TaxID=3040123 RepID=UPI0024416C38|nr:non-ribosomal peptide synthetase [Streptomyces sp. DH24]MDG9718400.1 non-ribosomal peptide synthetase [Streptomyces sp. DH24]
MSECPDRVGSVGIDGSGLTWRDIATSVRTLAGGLRQAGAGPGDRIAVMAGRSRYALSSLLAIWANGSSAVLLDERHPAERLRWTVRDAGCSVLVSSESEPNAAELGLALIETSGSETETETGAAAGTEAVAGTGGAGRPLAGFGLDEWTRGPDESEAYVVYTSGTTGRPKGVRIGSAALEHFLANAASLGYRPGSRAVCVVSPGFDGWLWSVLTPFVNAVTCVAIDTAFGQIEDALAAQEIDNLCMTPSLYAAMEKLPRAEVAVVAGERCPDSLVARLRESADRVLNVYGPTEATIATTMADTARGDDPRTIGRPMPGCTVTVVDADLNEVPPGVTGELLIGGAGVALGYVGTNAPGADRFLERDGVRYFRTGDRGMLRADGQLTCLGRMDNQVKIGGFRIELEEIESIACAVPGIERAVAYVRGEPGTLALGLLTASGGPLDADLRERLTHEFASRLPRQLCPTLLHRMAEVPLEPTGKVSRREVAELGDSEPSGGGHDRDSAGDSAGDEGADITRPARGDASQQPVLDSVMEAWNSVFGQSVAEDADFFAIGGHSLLAAQLASRIELQLEVAVSITDVLTARTPRALADRIDETRAA